MDELKALSAFVTAAELGSFNQAAIAQGMTPQAISKSVRQLERQLGVRLFHRTTHKSSLTEEGQRLFETTRHHVAGLAGALSRVQQGAADDEGVIRITAPPAIGRKVLVPLLAEYQAQHLRIETELILEEHFTDLVAERIDVGFRAGDRPEGLLVARRLFSLKLIVCAAPEYLRKNAWPASPEDLWHHRCTGFRHPDTGRLLPWEFLVDGEIVFRDVPTVFRTNDGEAETQAVLNGVAIGLLDSVNAGPALREGRLVPLLCEQASDRMGLHLYYGQRSDMPRRVRNFIDFAIARLSADTTHQFPLDELIALRHKARNGLLSA